VALDRLFAERVVFSDGGAQCHHNLLRAGDRIAFDVLALSTCQDKPACTVTRLQKITLGEMRAMGIRGLLIYCSDYKCSHNVAISADRWPDDVRLSDLEPLFVLSGLRH
jgi:hypothetical protein